LPGRGGREPAAARRDYRGRRNQTPAGEGMSETPNSPGGNGWETRATGWRSQRRHLWRRFALFLAVVGPGVITSNVDNDAGGISTYSIAGAQYGYALLWSLIPMTILLYVSEEMCARMGVVTGKGLSDLIREEFGFRTTFFLMVIGFIVDLGNVAAEFAGVAASMQIFGVNKYIAVPIAGLAVWILVLRGTYRQVEGIFLGLHVLPVLRFQRGAGSSELDAGADGDAGSDHQL